MKHDSVRIVMLLPYTFSSKPSFEPSLLEMIFLSNWSIFALNFKATSVLSYIKKWPTWTKFHVNSHQTVKLNLGSELGDCTYWFSNDFLFFWNHFRLVKLFRSLHMILPKIAGNCTVKMFYILKIMILQKRKWCNIQQCFKILVIFTYH